jgi:ribosomal protein S5
MPAAAGFRAEDGLHVLSASAPRLTLLSLGAQVTGKCGSVTIRLTPAPRGAGIVAARTPKKVLQMAGIEDCYTCSRGSTKTLGNFVRATFNALAKTYGFLTPDLWRESRYTKTPFQVRGCKHRSQCSTLRRPP